MFIDSERNRRLAFAEDTLADTLCTLEDPAVADALGDYADPLIAMLSQVTIPRIVHGEVRLGRRERLSDAVPLVIIDEGEELYAGLSVDDLAPMQEEAVLQWAEELIENDDGAKVAVLADTVRNALSMSNEGKRMLLGRDSMQKLFGRVVSATGLTYPGKLISGSGVDACLVQGRPVIVMSPSNCRKQSERNVTLVHEGVHALQVLDVPVISNKNSVLDPLLIEDELEARAVGAAYGEALYYDDIICRDDRAALGDCLLDDKRREFADPDAPLTSNPRIVEWMKAEGYIIT